MTTKRELDRVVRSWLEIGPMDLPDYLLDEVRAGLDTTPQRRAWWPAWRFQDMNVVAKLGVAAAAVFAVAVVSITLLARPNGSGPGAVGSPSPRPALSQSPIASASPPVSALHDGALAPGRYRGNPVGTVDWTVTVPARFMGFGHDGLIPTWIGTGPPSGMGFAVLWVGKLYSDPCHGTVGDIDPGSSVDDLITAIRTQSMYRSSVATPVTIGGYAGKQIDIELPSDVDFARCTNNGGDPSVPAGTGGYFVWQSQAAGGANVFAQGPGNRFHVRVLDVAGTRVVVLTEDFAATAPADVEMMNAIVGSLEFQP